MTATQKSEGSLRPHWMPDFCSLRVLGAVVLLAQLVALVIVLVPDPRAIFNLQRVLAASFLVQWIALASAAFLCKLGPRIAHLSTAIGMAWAWAVPLAVTAIISAMMRLLDEAFRFGVISEDVGMQPFVIGAVVLSALFAAAALRYFYVQEQLRLNVERESEARVDALQARIRPHFLFNTLNTVASLIRIDPAAAERAVEDLAELFRASLSNEKNLCPLSRELELVDRYLEIESLRLGDRLRVERLIEPGVRDWPVPLLSLQPLVENAIHHGIQTRADGGTVRIEASEKDGMLYLRVHNPKPGAVPKLSQGNHIALDNIRQRLALHFGAKARLEVESAADYHAATLCLPRMSARKRTVI
jgi:two-component system, LytTR family, sensor histidine kinase AlgZ